jgi:signal transduction histidine kinase
MYQSGGMTQLLTPAARLHAGKMARAIAPAIKRLERRFRTILERRYDAVQAAALLAITPAAAAQFLSLARFLREVDVQGRRLAKLNVPPAGVHDALREFAALLDPVLGGRFQPAREQLHLATVVVLENAYYRVRESEAQTLFSIYRAQAEGGEFEDLLHRFVGVLTRGFRARAGRLLLVSGQQTLSPGLLEPRCIERGSREEALVADPDMRARYACWWSYPLCDHAVVQFGFATARQWLPRERALLEAVAERCRESRERARLEEEVRLLQAEARHREEEERRRIGRELHDEAGQSLLLLRLELEMLQRDAPPALSHRLQQARTSTERIIEELRRIVSALSPAQLERLGLESALRQLAARFRKISTAKVRLRIQTPPAGLPMRIQEVIYRVAQESLQNIAKHSQASNVNLLLVFTDKNIRLSVSDNGSGFDPQTAAKKAGSFGLAGMRERASLLGGHLMVRSRPKKGSTLVLLLPRPLG